MCICFTVKGVNFYGPKSEYVVSGSDCGNVFLWDKKSTDIVQCVLGDHEGVVSIVCVFVSLFACVCLCPCVRMTDWPSNGILQTCVFH